MEFHSICWCQITNLKIFIKHVKKNQAAEVSFLRWLHGLSLRVILEESNFYSSQEEPLGVVWASSYNFFWVKRGQVSWVCPTGRRPSGRTRGRSRSRWRDHFSWRALASLCVVPQELEDEAVEIQAWVSRFTLLLPRPSIDKNVMYYKMQS